MLATRKHSSRMHTASLPTIHVVVATTRCQYQGVGILGPTYRRYTYHSLHMYTPILRHTHPTLRHTHPTLRHTHPTLRHTHPLDISTYPPELDIPTLPLEGTWDQTYPPWKGPGIRHTHPQRSSDQAYPPVTCEQTHACENITFPQLLLRS